MELLSELKIFKNVDYDSLLEEIRIIDYEKNEYIIKENLDNSNFYYLIEGKVSLYSNTIHGKKKIYFTLDKNNMINDVDFTMDHFPYNVKCFEKAKVMVISKSVLEAECEHNTTLLKNILNLQAMRSKRLYRQLKDTVSISIEKKLAAQLWKLSNDYGITKGDLVKIDFKINNTYLANLIGCSRESVSKAMHKLMDMELVYSIDNKLYVKQEEILNYYRK